MRLSPRAGTVVLMGYFLLLFNVAGVSSAADDAIIRAIRSQPFTPAEVSREQAPVLLGDRFEYRGEDPTGQFYLVLPKPSGDGEIAALLKGHRVHIAVNDAATQNLIAETSLIAPEHRKVHFTIAAGALDPGKYVVVASLRGANDRLVGEPLLFSFTRSGEAQAPAAFPPEGLPIQLPAQAWVRNAAWPTRASVPLPVGLVDDPRRLALYEDGMPIAADVHGRVVWHVEGSAKWAHVQFVARYRDDGSPREYRLKLLPQPVDSPATALRVQQGDERIVVDTGSVKFEVGRKAFAGIEKAWYDPSGKGQYDAAKPVIDGPGGPVLVDGRAIRWEAALDKEAAVEIEEQGPASVTILARGWYRQPGDQRLAPICQFVTRITAYAEQPSVRVRHHTILAYDTRTQYLRELGFHIATPLGRRYAVGVDGASLEGDLLADPSAPPVFAHQDRFDHLRLVQGEKETEGKRVDGWFSIGSDPGAPGLAVLLRDVWQRFPKEIEMSGRGISIYSWPKHGRRSFASDEELALGNIHKFWCFHQGALLDLNLPSDYYERLKQYPGTQECLPEHALNGNGEGLAIGEDFVLLFGTGVHAAELPGLAKLFDEDPTGLPPADWNAATGAMGTMAAVDRACFSAMEEAIEKGFLSYTRSVERGNAYGVWNYADTHTYWDPVENRPDLHRVWHNSHYHEVGLGWLLYYRSGSRDLLRWARASTHHYIHVDTVNFALQNDLVRDIRFHLPGSMYHCKGLTHWGSEARGMERRDGHGALWGHWVDPDASLWAWYLDGDRRANDVYQMWHRSVREFGLPVAGTAREINTSLAIAVELYNATFDPDLLPHIHGMAKGLLTVPLEQQNPGPMWHPMWINRYYALTRDPSYRDWILRYGREESIGNTWVLGLSALAYELSGDKSYLTHHFERLSWFPRMGYQDENDPLYAWYGVGPGPLGSGWAWDTWGTFLAQLHRAGIDKIGAPTTGRGYCMYSPVPNTLTAGPTSLTLLVHEPHDRPLRINTGFDFRNHGQVTVTSPSGKVLLHEQRQNESAEDFGWRTFPADGESGIDRLDFRSHWSALKQPLSDADEAILLSSGGQEYRIVYGGRYYLVPLNPEKPVQVTITMDTPTTPANFVIEDAAGAIIESGSIFGARGRREVSFTLDPSRHRFPWALDAVGSIRLICRIEGDGKLLAGRTATDVQRMVEPARRYLEASR